MAKLTIQIVKNAITDSGGVITTIAARCHVTRKALYQYLEKHEQLKDSVAEEKESLIDIAEEKLIDAVKSGESWAVKYILSTIGKNRGYIQGQEIGGRDGKPIEFKSDANVMLKNLSGLTDEQLRAVIEKTS